VKIPFLEGSQGATKQNPGASETLLTWEEHKSSGSSCSENLEELTEKVGTLDLKSIKKNRSGAAKKQARRARLAEAPDGTSASNQPQQGSSKGVAPTSKQPDADPKGAWNIWDHNKTERAITQVRAWCDWA
jgi:hypothetical protein